MPLSRLHVLVLCLFAAANSPAAEDGAWTRTLDRIASGVVSIRVDSTRAFDTEWNSSSQATGFVVDAERGLILTNRHVVTPGPVVAEAIFRNNEEVRLTPVYRDPVHDFGFFRYDPSELRYIEPTELPLVPDGAAIGREIRVVGNDAGEQLSILSGTIARLDRKAPDYGHGNYNDFNTFYYQAASGTSGGSSGSPVINVDGEVVALNAGANSAAASSFFLPLDRIERVLGLLQAGQPVPRGSLQTMFDYKPFDELERLGLTEASEHEVRTAFPKQTGMLTVQQVIPKSPADGKLEPGDVVIRVNGELVTEFVPLAVILDDHVGQTVELQLERGGKPVVQAVTVSDLHRITPFEYIEVGDANVNNLSYQQARHYNLPIEGVYVANPGYLMSKAAVPRGAVITRFGTAEIRGLDDFEKALDGLADGSRAQLHYVTMDNPQNTVVMPFEMDRVWFPVHRCRRDDETGLWPCRNLGPGPAPSPPVTGSTRFAKYEDSRVNAIAPSLVVVTFDLPYPLSGVAERHYYGTGIVVDTDRGLVVVDRNTVPIAIGDVTITFAGSLEVKAKIEQVHPLHNLAIVSYDPATIGDTPVRAATFKPAPLQAGEQVWAVGIKADHQLVHQQSTVASVDPLILPLSRTLRFRDSNIEVVSLVNGPQEFDGVIVDKHGSIASTWSSFDMSSAGEAAQINRGIPGEIVTDFVATMRSGKPYYSLEADLTYAPLFAARNLGVSEDWLTRLEQDNPLRRRALVVTRLVAGSPAADVLRNGDILLSVDGTVVTSFSALEDLTQKPAVTVAVWRDDKALEIPVATASLSGRDIDHAVSWAGALLQDPHRPMAAQRSIPPYGVYVAYFSYGSPATRYGLWAGRRIVQVDETATPDLETFIASVAGRKDQASVRLTTVTWNGAVEVITLKLDNHYWPAYELRRTADNGWVRTTIDG